MPFGFLDPYAELEAVRRKLPHWEQEDVTYFITFRTADSMPRAITEEWRRKRDVWLTQNHIDPSDPNWQSMLKQLPRAVQERFHKRFSKQFQRYLDAGYGECHLKRPELAKIVADSLLHFEGERYHLGDFIVMPNHVHLLVQFMTGTGLRQQCGSWRKFCATQINRKLGRRGAFWQAEPFDHIVRSWSQFRRFQLYIAENPKKANLGEGEYFYYQRPS